MSHDTLLSLVSDSPRQPAFLQHFILAKKVEGRSPRTLEWYEEAVRSFAGFCHCQGVHFLPADVQPVHIRMWVAHLQEKGLSKASVNSRFRGLRAFLNWCLAEGITNASPFRNIKTPSPGKVVVPVFSPEHIRSMLWLCPPNTWWGARDRAIILTLLHTGIRLGELTGLKLEEVDLKRQTVKVTGKGDKERCIYLDGDVLRAMLQYLRHRGDTSSYLWLSRYGTPITAQAVKQLISDLGKRAGIKGVRCSAHTFRHTFAVNFLKAGGSLRHLQEIMGHTSMKPLEVYLRTVSAEDAMEAHRRVRPFKGWQL